MQQRYLSSKTHQKRVKNKKPKENQTLLLTVFPNFAILYGQKKEGLHRPHLALRLRGSDVFCFSRVRKAASDGAFPSVFFIFVFTVWRCLTISSMEHQINEEIRDKEVRLIDADGNQLGVVPIAKAQEAAAAKNLDLVKIAPHAVPPVCRVMDYGKFRFEQAKREKEARKNQHVVEIKEIRLSPGIDVNDFNVKTNHAKRFLKEGNKVKVSVRFRGREVTHSSIGLDLLRRFAENCSDIGSMEKAPKLEGRQMIMFLAPKKDTPKKDAKKSGRKGKSGKPQQEPQTESSDS